MPGARCSAISTTFATQPGTVPGPFDQNVNLTPRQTQSLRSFIGGLMANHVELCQRPDDVRPVPSLLPFLVRQGRNAPFGDRCGLSSHTQALPRAHEC